MFTILGFAEDIDGGGTEQELAGLADQHLFVSGDNIRVPPLNQLLGAWGGLGSGGEGILRIEAPSIRDSSRLHIKPINHLADSDAEPSDPLAFMDLSENPRRFDVDEQVTVRFDSDTSAAAFQWAFLMFGDGPVRKAGGEVRTVRATGTTSQTARLWSTVTLTFEDTLLLGRYQVVGLRAYAASLIAARFVFKPGTWRPGCPGADSFATMDYPLFRMGRAGVWGEFHSTTPPDIECLSDLGDTAQEFEIDLVKVS